MIMLSRFLMRMQPRCDEPWTEVVYEDAGEGKLTVRSTTESASRETLKREYKQ